MEFMKSLKDALMKVGLKETASPKAQNHREKVSKKKLTETVLHQEQRNYCEECNQVRPDVEYYAHRNPTTQAEWICLRCVDRLKIDDTCRRTAQSETSIKKMFRREHGPTMTNIAVTTSRKPSGPVDGNR